jgi:hypothetical protein
MYPIICVMVIFSMTVCFAQMISTTGTPYQERFEAGIGENELHSTIKIPSQTSFETEDQQIGISTDGYDVAIYEVLKDGNALQVLMANNGTIPANITNWRLVLNEGASEYIFPSFALDANSIVTVHSQENANTSTDLYGSNFMSNEARDVMLVDQMGNLVSEYVLAT